MTELTGIPGPLMFHQSGGCCDGLSRCATQRAIETGAADVKLADLDAGLSHPSRLDVSVALVFCSHTHLTETSSPAGEWNQCGTAHKATVLDPVAVDPFLISSIVDGRVPARRAG